MTSQINNQLVLISGESGMGKSASLRNLRNQERVVFCNCEAGKELPFRNKFFEIVVTNPYQVHQTFDETRPGTGAVHDRFDTIIVDTLTFLMDMYESQYIIGSPNTMAAWGNYNQFFKILMQEKVASSDKAVIFLAHTLTKEEERNGLVEYKTSVPIKGALKNQGIEAYFSTVVAAKRVPLKELEPYKSELLHITPDDEIVGYKHVFQTRPTKATTGERIRSPMGLFSVQQTYMDNDAQLLLDHLHAFYHS